MKKELLEKIIKNYPDKIIDGKDIANRIKENLKNETKKLIKEKKIQPGLAVVLVGDNPASKVYVKSKERACQEIGFLSTVKRLPQDISESDLLSIIGSLNSDIKVHGILVQLPLPRHINGQKILYAISPDKDVDGFHPFNVGKMLIGDPKFLPCTPAGILELLIQSNVKTSGKSTVIVGRSLIVGKPMANLMVQKGIDSTVTIAHSKTTDIKDRCKNADIIIAAMGVSKFIQKDMVKDGSVIIDVGMNRDDDGTLCGDVDFANVIPIVSKITPVPGGVGPMTIAMLMKNTFLAAQGKSTL